MQKLQGYWFRDNIQRCAYLHIWEYAINSTMTPQPIRKCFLLLRLWSLKPVITVIWEMIFYHPVQSHDVNLATSSCMSHAVSWCELSNHAETTGILVWRQYPTQCMLISGVLRTGFEKNIINRPHAHVRVTQWRNDVELACAYVQLATRADRADCCFWPRETRG